MTLWIEGSDSRERPAHNERNLNMLPKLMYNEKYVIKKQVKFPRSKKKRIIKKWSKKPENFVTIPDPNTYFLGGDVIVGHPETIKNLREALLQCKEEKPHLFSLTFP